LIDVLIDGPDIKVAPLLDDEQESVDLVMGHAVMPAPRHISRGFLQNVTTSAFTLLKVSIPRNIGHESFLYFLDLPCIHLRQMLGGQGERAELTPRSVMLDSHNLHRVMLN
jgi:hypothetical protein